MKKLTTLLVLIIFISSCGGDEFPRKYTFSERTLVKSELHVVINKSSTETIEWPGDGDALLESFNQAIEQIGGEFLSFDLLNETTMEITHSSEGTGQIDYKINNGRLQFEGTEFLFLNDIIFTQQVFNFVVPGPLSDPGPLYQGSSYNFCDTNLTPDCGLDFVNLSSYNAKDTIVSHIFNVRYTR